MYLNVTYRHDTLISTCVAGTVAAPGRNSKFAYPSHAAAIFVVVLNMHIPENWGGARLLFVCILMKTSTRTV